MWPSEALTPHRSIDSADERSISINDSQRLLLLSSDKWQDLGSGLLAGNYGNVATDGRDTATVRATNIVRTFGPISWYHGDLTAITGAVGSPPYNPIGGYGWEAGRSKQVAYITNDGHIHELGVAVGGSWYHADLTSLTGAPNASNILISGYNWEAGRSRQVVYRTADAHIHELYAGL